ncbi:hypothetical protein JHK84_040385 [Glycine max]|nr:hypothetical protein JHK86_040168 [Glycine max]KAG4965777.1 hypothetical protein JHK85_040752 [Glycine max]KAG5122045.1 hypothetical protein JHK84_040385 [Glycine max]
MAVVPHGIPIHQTIYRDTPTPFNCPYCAHTALTTLSCIEPRGLDGSTSPTRANGVNNYNGPSDIGEPILNKRSQRTCLSYVYLFVAKGED